MSLGLIKPKWALRSIFSSSLPLRLHQPIRCLGSDVIFLD